MKRLSLAYACIAFLMTASARLSAQGTWTMLRDTAPNINTGVMILLSDGSVICKATYDFGYGNDIWNKLTPDSAGSYVNGTWSTIAPMADERLYFSSQVLRSGKVYVAGGEYGSGVNKAEIYDPVADTWTSVPTLDPGDSIADANSQLLPDGRVMQNIVNSNQVDYGTKNLIYDPATNSFSYGPSCVGDADESAWVTLPDNSILFVNIHSLQTDRYHPSLGRWKRDASAPVMLYDNYIYETGPAVNLPDGSVLFLGANSNTAIYIPSGDTTIGAWFRGPQIPGHNGIADGSAAAMADGRVLCAVSPAPNGSDPDSIFHSPTYFYEFDYLTDSFTLVSAPTGGPFAQTSPPSIPLATYGCQMLNLPDGNVLFSSQYFDQYYIYTPGHPQIESGKPYISTVSPHGCEFMITGLLFNGISEGAAYGDDWQMSTNYPIIRLQSGNRVYYARTHDWNHVGVQLSGNDTTYFSIPVDVPAGDYTLYLSANGISSDPFTFHYTKCHNGISETIRNTGVLRAYPNPAHHKTMLVFPAESGEACTMRLSDTYGRTVWQEAYTAVDGFNNYSLDLSSFARGIYTISVEQAGSRQTIKVTVE